MSNPEPRQSSPPDRFTILRLHAKGGLGQVSLARDEKLNRNVALKEIRPDKRDQLELHARFVTEAEITGQLEHPGIVPIYDLEHDSAGQVRYAMRFVQGKTLRDAIREHHARPTLLGFRDLLQRFVSVCQTMAYAHNQRVIHRDLKPANILLGEYGETLVVDWGLAKRLSATSGTEIRAKVEPATFGSTEETTDFSLSATSDHNVTQAGQILGTLAYMSPEQAAGDVEKIRTPADIYCLGAVLYEILTGHIPYEGLHGNEVLAAVRNHEFIRPGKVRPGVPRGLEAICLKAMALRMEDRYANASELATDVERWLADEPVSAHRESLWSRFVRWRRRNKTLVIAITVLCATALIVGSFSLLISRRDRALRKVDALQEATPESVPFLLDELDISRSDVQARLRELWRQESRTPSRQARVGLALLPVARDEVSPRLVSMMLAANDPQEMLLIRDRLAAQGATLAPQLWDEVRRTEHDAPRRFRLLIALAAFDPQANAWNQYADGLAAELIAVNSLHVADWTKALKGVGQRLVTPLNMLARRHRETEKGRTAASILSVFAADRPDLLTELLLAGSPEQFAILWPHLATLATTPAAIQRELDRLPASDAETAALDELAGKQASAAIALLKLGREDSFWPLLRASPTPRLRTYLIHRLAALDVQPGLLRERLASETDASIRIAILLSLGEYSRERVPPMLSEQIVEQSTQLFRHDPNSGVHSAAEWLLRRWGETSLVREEEEKFIAAEVPRDRQWYLTPAGHRFTIIAGPTVFPYFKYDRRKGPDQLAKVEMRTIPYSFAIDTRKVTFAHFRRYLQDHSEPTYSFAEPQPGDDNLPATQVTWIMAAKYCRWLSEREQIPEMEMCFPPMEQIKEGVKLPDDYTTRTGYRLPTEEEWECACRGGTLTRCFFGSDVGMMKHYAWHAENSGRRMHDVAQLKPSDNGLFDLYGLTIEYTSDIIFFSPEIEERIWRGSDTFQEPHEAGSSNPGIRANRVTYVGNECGLRIVRTLPGLARP